MPDLHLAFRAHILLIILAGAASMGAAWFSYRITVPPVSSTLKRILIALRSLSLFLLALLIGEPLLSIRTSTSEPPTTIVLIDNSKSMTIRDKAGDRSELVRSTLRDLSQSRIASQGKIRYVVFDTRAKQLSSLRMDSILFAGDGTDISQAIASQRKSVSEHQTAAIILLTDGNSTGGVNPLYEAERLGVPVFSIGIGDTSQQKDVLVQRVLANEISYVGSPVPVNARIRGRGFGGERVEVQLQQNGTVLSRSMVTLQPGSAEYPVQLSFTPESEGLQKVTVTVSHLNGELTERNNSSSFFTKVLKSKMKVLLVAGAPSPDVSAVRASLEADKNFEVTVLAGKKDGEFYGGTLGTQLIADTDCMILIGYPTTESGASGVALVRDALQAGKPFFFMMSRLVDVRKLSLLNESLPFSLQQASSNEFEFFAQVSASQVMHPILKSEAVPETWSKLPPLFRLQATTLKKADAEVLATTRLQSTPLTEPTILVRNTAGRKAVAFLGYGIWRWKLLGDEQAHQLTDAMFANTVRWLTTREDDRTIRVKPSKEVFSSQDPIEFSAQVYDASYQPVRDAQVTVTIKRKGEQWNLLLSPLENGQYAGALDPLEEGDYSYHATVTSGSTVLGEEKGSFSVGGINAEFVETKMNRLLLEQLAAKTGGAYVDAGSIAALEQAIVSLPTYQPHTNISSSEVELWSDRWMLALVVLLFAVEWFLRKRSGML